MHLFSFACKLAFILVSFPIASSQNDQFKINKLNLIYNKAQHSLGPTKLKDLKNELLKHEVDELKLKTLKAHNQDKDGMIQASVRKKLLQIMSKYSIERYFEDINSSENLSSIANLPMDSPTFRDSKLDKLWKKAEKAGFDQDQLMVLHDEFQHQQDKLDEHYETLSMLEQEIDLGMIKDERQENSIEEDTLNNKKRKSYKTSKSKKEKESEKKARLNANMEQGLKEKHSEIKNDIHQLSKKVSSRRLDDKNPFEESHVNELWNTAVNSNFTKEELDSLKEELEHYETRIKKLKHFQNQLERHEIGVKSSKSYSEDEREVRHVKEKVQELVQKVEKAAKTIQRKISRVEL